MLDAHRLASAVARNNTSTDEILPLVSILIPTFNRPVLFEKALQSAVDQTYPNIEIVICDDSTNDDTENVVIHFIKKLSFIRYYKNTRRLGQFENDLKLFDLSRGKYINYLMDDDLFHPEKIERMMNYYLNDPLSSIRLITSHRQVMDTNGNYLNDIYTTQKLFENDTLLDSRELARLTMLQRSNFIGEPTTVLFRKKDLTEPFGTLLAKPIDLVSWTKTISRRVRSP